MNLSIIIPAAGLGKRMKSYGPKSLINIEGKNLLTRQIEILSDIYPSSDIVVVGGFEHEKVSSYIETSIKNNKVNFVVNHLYSNTNVSRSIEIGSRYALQDNVLIVYGDLVFNKETFSNLMLDTSGLLLDTNSNFDNLEVGIKEADGLITELAYSSNTKWAQIAFLEKKDILNFNKFVNVPHNERMFAFEIFNMMIESGSKLKTYKNEKMSVAEVDDSNDIDRVRKLAQEGRF